MSEGGLIETILRWLGYVKTSELDVMKIERDGWKDAAQSWQRLATILSEKNRALSISARASTRSRRHAP
jgi:hypothetical protein